MNDDKLWEIFSKYIRLRDSDENGNCKCFTCGKVLFWKQMECGHGISRYHMATKYDEKNNHAQCNSCNSFNDGREERYKAVVDYLYGAGTWESLRVKARKVLKLSLNDIVIMEGYYRAQVEKLLAEKGLN